MSKKPALDTVNITRTRSRSNPKEANVSKVTSRFRAKLATTPNVSLASGEKMAESGGQGVVAKKTTDPGKTKPPATSTSASLGGKKTSPPGQRVDKPGKPTERGAQKAAHTPLESPPEAPEGLEELNAGMDKIHQQLLLVITAAMETKFGEMKKLVEAEMAKIPDLVAEKFDERWREEKETLRKDMAALDARLTLSVIRLQGDTTDQINKPKSTCGFTA